jgi:hypothetical protein
MNEFVHCRPKSGDEVYFLNLGKYDGDVSLDALNHISLENSCSGQLTLTKLTLFFLAPPADTGDSSPRGYPSTCPEQTVRNN